MILGDFCNILLLEEGLTLPSGVLKQKPDNKIIVSNSGELALRKVKGSGLSQEPNSRLVEVGKSNSITPKHLASIETKASTRNQIQRLKTLTLPEVESGSIGIDC